MHIFGCLSVLLLFVVVLAFSLVRGFFRILFGGGTRNDSASRQQRTYTSRQDEDTARSSSGPYPSPKKKVIDEDEGEYVDFEEVDK